MKANGNGAKLLNPPRYKQDWRQICAILPAYLPDGTNGTEITYLDGTKEYIANRLCWVLDDLLGHLRSSKAILTAQSRRLLGDKVYRVPLILCDEFILVPVKGREAIGKYDSLLGYIVLHYVTQIVRDNKKTIIYFGSDVTVTVYDYLRTVRQNIERANMINR
ncbi:MAG: hypothetical protein II218_04195, partial [Peptococcaceae bacterium]|nr:hypothetical protein [Peptococcaceae bacterium]